jgi:hypothetical protein
MEVKKEFYEDGLLVKVEYRDVTGALVRAESCFVDGQPERIASAGKLTVRGSEWRRMRSSYGLEPSAEVLTRIKQRRQQQARWLAENGHKIVMG